MIKAIKEKLTRIFGKAFGKESSRLSKIMTVGIILLIIVLIIGMVRQNMSYDSFNITNTIEKNDNVSVNYEIVQDGLIRYSKNGASYSNKAGKTVWNQAFEMPNAKAVVDGNYVAIGDIGSNEVRIFDLEGQRGIITAPYPIEDIEMSAQGVAAVIVADSSSNYIKLYDSIGTELVSIRATISDTGYPINIALSEDGQKLAVSYLFIDAGQPATRIVFYHFGSAGQNELDNIMGTFEYDTVFPKIDFFSNNEIVAYGEDKCIIYMMQSVPEVQAEIAHESEVRSIFSNSQYIGFIFRNNDALITAEDNGKYRMMVYTTGGRLVLDKNFDFDYQTVTGSEYEIILYNEMECLMFEYNGREKFGYTFDSPISSLLPKATRNEYILIDDSSIQEIQLR